MIFGVAQREQAGSEDAISLSLEVYAAPHGTLSRRIILGLSIYPTKPIDVIGAGRLSADSAQEP
ncbi:hypothetical protein [Yersinia vastinensis]|uniref:hypothetical protein n=1 Tax=Yersinia vastinensis TaxID=2890318 RepID=UPI00067B5FAD|nr:hypothetical protein [Yersinia vastinensis]